jgi:hypothetical protein
LARARWLAFAAVAAAAALAGASLLRPGFYDSHDGLLNVHRLFELEKCLADGQLLCRWAPDMGRGYGYPLFNFYPPLPTWIAAGLRGLGASPLDAVEGAFLLALFVGAASMFRLAASFFGASGGALAAILYTFAPYQAIDVFVRGSLAETWGMALLPLVFHAGYRAVAAPGARLGAGVGCAVAWAALLSSHDLMAMMAAPAYGAWLVLAWRRSGSSDRARGVRCALLAHGLAAALAAFFVLPLLFELRYVHSETLVSLHPWARYENNFVGALQLLVSPRPWGYGAIGTPDAMSLQAGRLHVGLGLAALLFTAGLAARARRLDAPAAAALLLGAAGLAALFLVLPGSRFLWELVPPLAWLQFPWRFLAIAAFGLAFAAGGIPFALRERPGAAAGFAAAAALMAIASGWQEFRPSALHVVRPEVLANEREVAKARHGLYDFLPRGVDLEAFAANTPPPLPPPVEAPPNVVLRGVERRSDRVRFEAEVRGEEAVVRLEVFDFPGWTLTLDGAPAPFAASDDPFGRLHVRLAPGRHTVVARFENTPVRAFANALSLLAAVAAALWTAAALRAR